MNCNKKPTSLRVPAPPIRQAGSPTRPQPFDRVSKHVVQSKLVVAPPVYRPPQAAKTAQPKLAIGVVNRKQPVAPPIYRPAQKRIAQTPVSPQATTHKQPSVPSPHRPQSKPSALQPKLAPSSQSRQPPVTSATRFRQAGSIQCMPARVQVNGLSHLVARNPGRRSIYTGDEGPEVTAADNIVVETTARMRSRRGPNQEMFSGYDRVGNRMYRWYLVRSLNGRSLETPHYIREDTFDFVRPTERPAVTRDLSGQNRRTRQSHKLIRLEAWYNTDRNLDQAGHMILYDYERQTYRQYAIAKEPRGFAMSAQRNEQSGKFLFDFGGPVAKYHDKRESQVQSEPKTSEPKHLLASEMPIPWQMKYMTDQRRGPKDRQVPRFNEVLKCDLLVTPEEYEYMLHLFTLRIAVGNYNFVYEALTEHNPFATRCLSMVEDLACLRRLTLTQGYADDVLRNFILQSTIDVGSRAKQITVDEHLHDVLPGRR